MNKGGMFVFKIAQSMYIYDHKSIIFYNVFYSSDYIQYFVLFVL